jgi:hypothetical protein
MNAELFEGLDEVFWTDLVESGMEDLTADRDSRLEGFD